MWRQALTGAIAGAALEALPGAAGPWGLWLGAAAGGLLGALLLPHPPRVFFSDGPSAPERFAERFAPLLLLAFFVPALTMAAAPGAEMPMQVALARALRLDLGVLSPAWGDVDVGLFPRGFPALVALIPLPLARAGLVAAGLAYLAFWAGLSALLEGPLRAPWPRTFAALALLLSRLPQDLFSSDAGPAVLALGLGLLGAATLGRSQPRAGPLAALLFAGAAATDPAAACATALVACGVALYTGAWRSWLIAAAGLCVVLAALAWRGPALSPRELAWLHDSAAHDQRLAEGALGGLASVLTALAAALLLFQKRWAPVVLAVASAGALAAAQALLPRLGVPAAEVAPLLLVPMAALWAEAAQALSQGLRRPPRKLAGFALALLCAALPGHLRWFQRAAPGATRADLRALACVEGTVPAGDVLDSGPSESAQWLPALTGHAITAPQQHWPLFDETDAALARLPAPRWRFLDEARRDGPAGALCDGRLLRLR